LVSELAADGLRIRVLGRAAGRAALPDGVEYQVGDLTDPSSLEPALRGVCRVVHLAAALPEARATPDVLFRVNSDGTAALARSAKAAGVRVFILVSSAGVYGGHARTAPSRETDPPRPITAYQRSKLAAEEAVAREFEGSGIHWVVLRPSQVYGPGSRSGARLLLDVVRRRLWVHGPVPATIHPTFVGDLVAAIRLVLGRADQSGEVFNIGGERWLDYRDLIAAIGERLGHTPAQLKAPRWTAGLAVTTSRLWRSLGGTPPQRLERLAGSGVNWSLDTTKARSILGFQPEQLKSGLDATAVWLKQEGLV
jgi:nucleoside-diphosphate-sugar epimerase